MTNLVYFTSEATYVDMCHRKWNITKIIGIWQFVAAVTTVQVVTSQNVDKPKRRQPKRWQTETSTNQNIDKPKRRQTETSTNQNVDKPKRRQAETSTNQNVDKPKRRQTKTSTNQNVVKPKRRQTETSTLFNFGIIL